MGAGRGFLLEPVPSSSRPVVPPETLFYILMFHRCGLRHAHKIVCAYILFYFNFFIEVGLILNTHT